MLCGGCQPFSHTRNRRLSEPKGGVFVQRMSPQLAKTAIIGIRLERQLSGDKLPSLGMARDGRR
jgi:hypothetical protein